MLRLKIWHLNYLINEDPDKTFSVPARLTIMQPN